MQTVLDAAAHIAQEIEKTRQHLANLEQALSALRPLISVSIETPTLTFASSDIQTIEDVSVVKPARKKRTRTGKSSKAKTVSSPSSTLPKTGADLWLKCLGHRKLTVNDLAESAIKKLGLSEDARFAIRNRAGAWLNAAAKKNQVAVSSNKAGHKVYQVVGD